MFHNISNSNIKPWGQFWHDSVHCSMIHACTASWTQWSVKTNWEIFIFQIMSTKIIQNASAPQPARLPPLPSSNDQIISDCAKKSRNGADSILQPSQISVACNRGSMAGEEGGKSEVMLEYNFNELTKALPLNLLYFLPTDNSQILPLCSQSLPLALLFTMQG